MAMCRPVDLRKISDPCRSGKRSRVAAVFSLGVSGLAPPMSRSECQVAFCGAGKVLELPARPAAPRAAAAAAPTLPRHAWRQRRLGHGDCSRGRRCDAAGRWHGRFPQRQPYVRGGLSAPFNQYPFPALQGTRACLGSTFVGYLSGAWRHPSPDPFRLVTRSVLVSESAEGTPLSYPEQLIKRIATCFKVLQPWVV